MSEIGALILGLWLVALFAVVWVLVVAWKDRR